MRFSYVITFWLAFAFAAVAQPKLVGHRGCRNIQGIDENTIESLKYYEDMYVKALPYYPVLKAIFVNHPLDLVQHLVSAGYEK